jgi:ligand-binding sensor domain-containing protein
MIIRIFVFLFPFTLSAQTWNIFNSSNSNLPNNAIKCLAIDSNHVLWVGTDSGLASFDGLVWHIYNTSNSGIAANNIRSIAFDTMHNMWVGTLNNGVSVFNGAQWTTFNKQNSGLTSNFIKGITVDKNGLVWLATSNGLSVYDGAFFTTYNIFNSPLATNHFTHIAVGLNKLFIGSINGGFSVYDTVFNSYTIANSGFPDNTTLHTALDLNQKAWVATPSSGLVVYLNPNSWITYNTANSAMPVNSINQLCFDNTGNLWMTSPTQGLILKSGNTFMHYTKLNCPLPSDQLQCLLYDQGVVWVGSTFDGLIKVSGNSSIPKTTEKEVILFPNPATEYIVFPDGFDHANITNCFGAVLYDNAITTKTLSIANWPGGAYYCAFTRKKDEIKRLKFVIQK